MTGNPTWFDEAFYLKSKLHQLMTDEPNAGWTTQRLVAAIENAGFTPFSHFESFGLLERTSPNPYFNAYEYLQGKLSQLELTDPDTQWTPETLAQAISAAGMSLWDHFQQHGWKEGINPSNSFDLSGYFASKLAALQLTDPNGNWTLEKMQQAFEDAGLDPISHFEEFGHTEDLRPTIVAPQDRVPADPHPVPGTELEPMPEPAPQPAPEPPVTPTFEVKPQGSGVWSIGTENGTVNVSKEGEHYIFTPATGSAVKVHSSDVQALQVNHISLKGEFGILAELAGLGSELTGWGIRGTGSLMLSQPMQLSEDRLLETLPYTPISGGYYLANGNNTIALPTLGDTAQFKVTGSNGDDMFITSALSLSNWLSLDGGPGRDSLLATLGGRAHNPDSILKPTLTNIESLAFTAPNEAASFISLEAASGVDSLWSNNSTADLSVRDIPNKVALGVQHLVSETGDGAKANHNFLVRYADSAELTALDTQSLSLANASLNLLSITTLKNEASTPTHQSSGIEVLEISLSGASSISTFDETGVDADLAASLRGLDLSGAGTLALGALHQINQIDMASLKGSWLEAAKDSPIDDVREIDLDLSASTIDKPLAIRFAQLENGDKGDLTGWGAGQPKSDQSVKLPHWEKITAELTIMNMTIAHTTLPDGSQADTAVANDVLDLTAWSISDVIEGNGRADDLLALFSAITVSKGAQQNSAQDYLNVKLSLKDSSGAIILENLFSQQVYNSAITALNGGENYKHEKGSSATIDLSEDTGLALGLIGMLTEQGPTLFLG